MTEKEMEAIRIKKDEAMAKYIVACVHEGTHSAPTQNIVQGPGSSTIILSVVTHTCTHCGHVFTSINPINLREFMSPIAPAIQQ